MGSGKRLLLVGDDGSVNNSTGNSLIGLPFFQDPTNTCETFMGKSRVDNNLLWIVNTPGFLSLGSTPRARAINIQRYLEDLSFEPHTVLLIFNQNDGAAYQQRMKTMLQLTFGEEVFKHCIVVSTHSNVVSNEEGFPLQMIVDKCNGRSTTIQNSASNIPFSIPTEDVRRIMGMVDEMSDSGKYVFALNAERRLVLEEIEESGSDEDSEVSVKSLEERLLQRKIQRQRIFYGKCIVVLVVGGVVCYCTKRGIVRIRAEFRNMIIDVLNEKFPSSNYVQKVPIPGKTGDLQVVETLTTAGVAAALLTSGVATANPFLGIAGVVCGIGAIAKAVFDE